MVAVKRKATFDKAKGDDKRIKSAAASHHVIRVSAEGPAFQRGGGDVLNPIEKRQIRNQARQDLLREVDTGPPPAGFQTLDEDGLFSVGEPNLLPARPAKKRKQATKNGIEGMKLSTVVKEHHQRIEGLSYRKLAPGLLVLGQVVSVGIRDITLALPNNLVGYVPLNSVSDVLNDLTELNDEGLTSSGNQRSSQQPVSFPELRNYVRLGQYLRAVVTSNSELSNSHPSGKKRIELSITPQSVNVGLTKENIISNTLLQVEVVSTEDHGFVVSPGLSSPDTRGFLALKDMDKNIDASTIGPGAIILCLVKSITSNGTVIKLSSEPQLLANLKKHCLSSATSTVDHLLPGAVVEVLLSSAHSQGFTGKAIGLVNVTADMLHSGQLAGQHAAKHDFFEGSKVKARIVWAFVGTGTKTVGVSVLPHLLALSKLGIVAESGATETPVDLLPISTIKDDFEVRSIVSNVGLVLDVGVPDILGFAHISRVSDEKVKSISGHDNKFKVGSRHRGRVVGYNPMDGLFMLSFESRILDLPFLNLEEVPIGQKMNVVVERILSPANGPMGVIAGLTDSISGLIPETHFADVPLQLPERKFKVGQAMPARVLSVDHGRKHIRLTCKKTLLNTDSPVWKSYSDLQTGMKSPGTINFIQASGAILEFYGRVKGFLPVSEMSESFIHDPIQHFRVGQVLNVRIISLDIANARMTLSCRDPSAFETGDEQYLKHLRIGVKLVGRVNEKTTSELVLDLKGTSAKAILPISHLVDGSLAKCEGAAKRIRIGQKLDEIVVIGKSRNLRTLRLTNKSSLIEALEASKMPTSFEDIAVDNDVIGYVHNITQIGIFVQFANGLTGLLLKSHISRETSQLPNFGVHEGSTVVARVLSIDDEQQRFLLTQRDVATDLDPKHIIKPSKQEASRSQSLSYPVDGVSKSVADYSLDKLTKARVTGVKATQLNVELAEGVQGRIDVSQVFDTWDEIKDRKSPLTKFKIGQVLPVRVLGIHDSKNHRYLPITHTRTIPVFELCAKPASLIQRTGTLPTLDKVEVGSSWLCFVNNVANDCLWVNLTPNMRGRIHAFNASNDLTSLTDLATHFPIGSAVQARVLKVDLVKNWLDLTARNGNDATLKTLSDLRKGEIVPGRVIQVSETHIKVQLSETVIGLLLRVDIVDDFSKADPSSFHESQIIKACVVEQGDDRSKVALSTRPSRMLSSTLSVPDPEILSSSQLQVNQIVRGFVKNVTDKGIFVMLSRNCTAYVKVSNLSDDFIKDWRREYQRGQLVKGKVIALDPSGDRVQMSLKKSILQQDYRPRITWDDVEEGQIHKGKVRKVEQFGAFIVLENSANVSGLCHRSEIADESIHDARKLYEEGDLVKVKILRHDRDNRKLSLGMKTVYFEDEYLSSGSEAMSDKSRNGGEGISIENEYFRTEVVDDDEPDGLSGVENANVHAEARDTASAIALTVDGFDWTGEIVSDRVFGNGNPDGVGFPRSISGSKLGMKWDSKDATAELDAKGLQSISDYERRLMTESGSSFVWLSYMSFHLGLGEVDKAREVGQRAIRAINIQNEEELMNVWMGLLNLEQAYGEEESLNLTLKSACQYNDEREVHRRLASALIQSKSYEVSALSEFV